jgi:hypothetical protein
MRWENALGEIFDTDKSFRFGRAHNDLILASRHFLDKLPFQVLWQHIKGHQLNNPFVEYRDLDRLSQLNEDMDILAKTILSQVEHTVRPIQHKVFGEPWTIWHRSEKLCRDIPQRLYDIIDGPACLSYWARHDKFGNASHHDVDWDSTREFMSTIDPKRARWLTKHTSGHCPVGTVMKKRTERITNKCPHCGQPETPSHVWTCPHPPVKQKWEASLRSLDAWLENNLTDPSIRRDIITGLRAWIFHTEDPDLDCAPARLQACLGWESLLEGRPAKGWLTLQHAHFKSLGKSRTGKQWLVALLQ